MTGGQDHAGGASAPNEEIDANSENVKTISTALGKCIEEQAAGSRFTAAELLTGASFMMAQLVLQLAQRTGTPPVNILMAAHNAVDQFVMLKVPQKCRVCGCTDEDCTQCIVKTGEPCHWVAADLCSACAPHGRLILTPDGRGVL